MRQAANDSGAAKRGFTLLEIALVLAIIVVVGAVAAPMFQGTLRTERLRKGAELIAADWVRTRSVAMETGETQVWMCQIANNSFSASSYNDSGAISPADAAAAVSAATGLTSTGSDSGSFGQSAMPDGVSIGDVLVSEGDTVVMMAETGNTGDGGSALLFFYPDGTSSSARLSVANDQEQTMSVVLNGMAGTVRVISGGSSQ